MVSLKSLGVFCVMGVLHVQAFGASAPLKLRIMPRTPEQIGAFYEARGFPSEMVALLKQQCFMTISIHNTSQDVIWLDLKRWRFTADGKPLPRIDRARWQQRWATMNIPLASQSTFRWTLLPESLDFQPDEAEGGNITLQRTSAPITLEADFQSARDRRGPLIKLRYDDLRCADDAPGHD